MDKFFLLVNISGLDKCVASAPTNIFSDGMLVDCSPSITLPPGATSVLNIRVRCNASPTVNRSAKIMQIP
jgi:hypothetical protein